jgi:hypothetical protein
MSTPKLYRVTVIEWLSHKALIEAEGPEQQKEAYMIEPLARPPRRPFHIRARRSAI